MFDEVVFDEGTDPLERGRFWTQRLRKTCGVKASRKPSGIE